MKEYLRIKGMTCVNCENTIQNALLQTEGIISATANYNLNLLIVEFDENILNIEKINNILKEHGYGIDYSKKHYNAKSFGILSGILILLFVIFFIFSRFDLFNRLNIFPSPNTNDTELIMLFVIGLLTSFHCVAMCGAINLSQTANKHSTIKSTILYNVGRVISYTIIGIIVGAIGSVFSFNPTLKGGIILFTAILMLIMGLNQLNLFPFLKKFTIKMPKSFSKMVNSKKVKSSSPFIVGLLNGLMPCGPLQTMQIYALSVGSWYLGGLSMFIFALGTVPLMFLVGSLANILKKKFSVKIIYASSIIIMVLSLFMFSNSFNLLGINLFNDNNSYITAVYNEEKKLQEVEFDLEYKYASIQVAKEIEVEWIINVEEGALNSCNYQFSIKEYNLTITLVNGKNIIHFTPNKAGTYTYVCLMGMRKANIKVI
jgi:sulfite exporter TauE/SafE/copper chaperone CopZ